MAGYQSYATRAAGGSSREEEALAFRLLARTLHEASDPPARNNALAANHRVWSAVMREAGASGSRMPPVLRDDLIRLAAWSMRLSNEAVLNRTISLRPLAELNADMADGLGAAELRSALVAEPVRRASAVAALA